MKALLKPLFAGLILAGLSLPAIAQQPGTPQRLRGTIEALNGNVLSITTREGDKVDVNLSDGFRVNYGVPKTLADIQDNSFVGAAAIERDGKLVALEVLVFPEAARGSGEGHYPWDLTPDSNMTNATVNGLTPEGDGVVMNVKYPDGEKEIVVPSDIPVWTFEPGDASLLTAGKAVFIGARKLDDGTFTAGSVIVEKDGFKPPN
jgi:hypothetical protein